MDAPQQLLRRDPELRARQLASLEGRSREAAANACVQAEQPHRVSEGRWVLPFSIRWISSSRECRQEPEVCAVSGLRPSRIMADQSLLSLRHSTFASSFPSTPIPPRLSSSNGFHAAVDAASAAQAGPHRSVAHSSRTNALQLGRSTLCERQRRP
jgi:hypothetical protein